MDNNYKFKEFNAKPNEKSHNNQELLQDIPMTYSVQMGKGKMKFKELQSLQINDTLPLNHLAGDLFTLMIGEGEKKRVASGEIVEENGVLFFRVKKIG